MADRSEREVEGEQVGAHWGEQRRHQIALTSELDVGESDLESERTVGAEYELRQGVGCDPGTTFGCRGLFASAGVDRAHSVGTDREPYVRAER